MTKIVNLTPHDVNFVIGETTITIPTSGTIARCDSSRKKTSEITTFDPNDACSKCSMWGQDHTNCDYSVWDEFLIIGLPKNSKDQFLDSSITL